MYLAAFALVSLCLGALVGALAGRDRTRFFVGLGYCLLPVVAAVLLIVASIALFTGTLVLANVASYAAIYAVATSAAYSLTFWAVRRYSARRNSASVNAT